jgi:hypothetical protein
MAEARRITGVLLSIAVVACGRGDTRRSDEVSVDVDAAAARTPLLARVDHFFATSAQAEAHFNFFRDIIGLAVAWPYKSYGNFASGGLSLGNTVLEMVTWAVGEGETLQTEWKSLAFEPVGDTEAAVAELNHRGISHSAPDVTRYKDSTGTDAVGWINTDLTGLSPSGAVFICDYPDRKAIHEVHRVAHDDLARRHGGPLGVIAVKEIVLGVTDLARASVQWRSLVASPSQESDGLFSFGDGPGIRLVQADKDGMREIVVGVRSVADARRFLSDRGLLEPGEARRVSIARKALGGLQVTLVDN